MGPQDRDGDAAAPRQMGLIPLIVFWCVVMGLLYAGMSVYLQPKRAQVLANGDLIIPRALDGHFYARAAFRAWKSRFWWIPVRRWSR